MLKLIFLDVDGVLNHDKSRARCGCVKGIDKDKVERLAKIINETGAKIVLSSTWKTGLDTELNPTDKYGKYLLKYLWEYGKIKIFDKTGDYSPWDRGTEIITWFEEHKDFKVGTWIVIDDEIFDDYRRMGILPRLVKTSWYDNGLQDEHVERAIELLNKEDSNDEQCDDRPS